MAKEVKRLEKALHIPEPKKTPSKPGWVRRNLGAFVILGALALPFGFLLQDNPPPTPQKPSVSKTDKPAKWYKPSTWHPSKWHLPFWKKETEEKRVPPVTKAEDVITGKSTPSAEVPKAAEKKAPRKGWLKRNSEALDKHWQSARELVKRKKPVNPCVLPEAQRPSDKDPSGKEVTCPPTSAPAPAVK